MQFFSRCYLLASFSMLGACGGGGSSGGADVGLSDPGVAITSSKSTLSGTVALSGTAATGAPVLGANIRVLDASGKRVDMVDGSGTQVSSVTTSTADGTYRLNLVTNKTPLPLFVQVSGVDGAGMPLVLHGSLLAGDPPYVAHVTPLSDAMVAMMLGGNPRVLLDKGPSVGLLQDSVALTTVTDFMKSLLAVGIADLKITSVKDFNLLGNPDFVTNRTAIDAMLDGIRVQLVQDDSGRDFLQISNKFLTPGVQEVLVNLAQARAELQKGKSGSLLKSVTSTLKVVTSAQKTSLKNLATLDALTSSINALIAQGASNTLISTTLLGSYTRQDGRSKAELAAILAGYAGNGMQLGRWQVGGCADDPIPASGCTKMQVSALVVNSQGQIFGVLHDTVSADNAKPPKWALIGNNRSAEVHANQVAQIRLGLDGKLPLNGALPTNGVQLTVKAQDRSTPPLPTISSASAQVPSGYGVRMVYCNVRDLCIAPYGGTVEATGELSDTTVQKTPGWVGSQDAAQGAKYTFTITSTAGSTETVNAYLQARAIQDLPFAVFPKLDNSLSLATLNTSSQLSWRTWAEANPGMRITHVRILENSPPNIREYPISNPMATSILIPAPTALVTTFQIWLVSRDALGRYFYSQYKSTVS